LALDTADSLTDPFHKVQALLEIAQSDSCAEAKAVWAKAHDFALSRKEEYLRAQTVGMVIRARLQALPAEETLTLIADRIKGDLQHYALWVVADEIAVNDKPVPPKAVERLYQLAQKAEFDRPSKKIKVFQRIAEAQARLGDFDGAYRTAGEPHPVNDIQTFRATQARAYVMKAIAEAQLKAKHRNAARDTVLSAIEMFAPLPEEDAEAYFPLADLCLLQAKAGDLAGALQTVGAVSSSAWKVHILAEIAVGHAEAGRQDDARKTIRMAFDASRRAPNDALWTGLTTGIPADFAQRADPMGPVLQTLANAQARIGDLDGAQKSLAEISSSGFGDQTRTQAIEQIVGTRLEAGDVAGARRVAELLPDDENPYVTNKSSLLERIAKLQAKKGDAADALDWAARQKTPGSRLYLLRGLAEGIVERITPGETRADGSAPKPRASN
jgi:hypothetical protein